MTEETWRDRLKKEIADKGMSMRGLSVAAGMAPGYVFSILSEGKDPTVDNLLRVCAALDVPMYRIVLGDAPSAREREVLELWKSAGDATRQGILDILRDQRKVS